MRVYLKTELLVLSKVELPTNGENCESRAKNTSGPCKHKVVRRVNCEACTLRKAFMPLEELRNSSEPLHPRAFMVFLCAEFIHAKLSVPWN